MDLHTTTNMYQYNHNYDGMDHSVYDLLKTSYEIAIQNYSVSWARLIQNS